MRFGKTVMPPEMIWNKNVYFTLIRVSDGACWIHGKTCATASSVLNNVMQQSVTVFHSLFGVLLRRLRPPPPWVTPESHTTWRTGWCRKPTCPCASTWRPTARTAPPPSWWPSLWTTKPPETSCWGSEPRMWQLSLWPLSPPSISMWQVLYCQGPWLFHWSCVSAEGSSRGT